MVLQWLGTGSGVEISLFIFLGALHSVTAQALLVLHFALGQTFAVNQ